MSHRSNNTRLYFLPSFIALCMSAIVFVISMRGPMIGLDTIAYLSHPLTRPPAYPILLDFFKLIFGQNFGIYLCTFQTWLVLSATLYFVFTLRDFCKTWMLPIIFCLIASPLYTSKIGNYLLTEAPAYSIFLICISIGFQIESPLQTTKYAAFAGLIALNTLFRPQMAFMYPVYLLLLTKQYYSLRNFKIFVKPLLFIVLAMTTASLFECSYNRIYNGIFTKSGMTGIQFAKDALYVSGMDDLPAFRNEPYYATIEKMYKDMDENKLFATYRYERDENLAQYQRRVSDVICWLILTRQMYHYYTFSTPDDTSLASALRLSWEKGSALQWSWESKIGINSVAWVNINRASFRIFHSLVRLKARQYITLILSRIKDQHNIFEILTLVTLLTYSFLRTTRYSIIIFLLTVATIMNTAMISATIRVVARYSFYTDILQPLALLFLLFDCFNRFRKKEFQNEL